MINNDEFSYSNKSDSRSDHVVNSPQSDRICLFLIWGRYYWQQERNDLENIVFEQERDHIVKTGLNSNFIRRAVNIKARSIKACGYSRSYGGGVLSSLRPNEQDKFEISSVINSAKVTKGKSHNHGVSHPTIEWSIDVHGPLQVSLPLESQSCRHISSVEKWWRSDSYDIIKWSNEIISPLNHLSKQGVFKYEGNSLIMPHWYRSKYIFDLCNPSHLSYKNRTARPRREFSTITPLEKYHRTIRVYAFRGVACLSERPRNVDLSITISCSISQRYFTSSPPSLVHPEYTREDLYAPPFLYIFGSTGYTHTTKVNNAVLFCGLDLFIIPFPVGCNSQSRQCGEFFPYVRVPQGLSQV